MFTPRAPSRRFLAALAATLVVLGVQGRAHAAPILFDPDGPGAQQVATVNEFGLATGNALAIGAQALINAVQASPTGMGTTPRFFTVFHARVSTVEPPNPPGGDPVFVPGVNSNRLTVVAGFWETATVIASPTPGGSAVTFSSNVDQTGSFFEIYSEPIAGGPANEETGLGFRDGTLILRGVHVPGTVAGSFEADRPNAGPVDQNATPADGSPNPDAVPTVGGNGGTGLNFVVTEVATAFFPNIVVGQTLAFFSSTNALPFTRTEPSDAFYTIANTAGALGANGLPTPLALLAPNYTPNLGAINGSGLGPDVIFESRGSFTFSAVVPEPGSVVLAITGLATVGLGSLRKLRRRSAVLVA